jgi:hypothetical protein
VGVVLVRFWRAEDTGEEANDAVGHGEGRKLSPGEDKISDGEEMGGDSGCDALIDPFVMATNENDVFGLAELLGVGLSKEFAGGIGEDDSCLGIRRARLYGLVDERGHHDHPGATAIRRIVNGSVIVGGEVTRVLGGERDKVLGLSAGDDAVIEGGKNQVGEKGYEVYFHCQLVEVTVKLEKSGELPDIFTGKLNLNL